MRTRSILAGVLAVCCGSMPAARADPYVTYDTQPFLVSELAFVAFKCGLRDKFWYLRVIYSVKSAIMKLDRTSSGVPSDVTEDSQMERMDQGQRAAEWALENDPKTCTATATPERMAEADGIQSGRLSVWSTVTTDPTPTNPTYDDAMREIDRMAH